MIDERMSQVYFVSHSEDKPMYKESKSISFIYIFLPVRDRRFVALKIVKSASHYTETAIDEMKLLRTVIFH